MAIDKSLFDLTLFDGLLFDDSGAGPTTPVGISDDVQFNGYGLQNANMQIITSEFHYSAPSRALGISGFPRAHGEYVQTDFFRELQIVVKGTISASSQVALEQLMDDMRKNLAPGAGLLQKTFAGAKRFWNAHCDMVTIYDARQHYNVFWAPWEITFIIAQPGAKLFGRPEFRDVFQPTDPATVAPTDYVVTNTGSADAEGIWIFSFVAVGSCSQLTLANLTSGDTIVVSHTGPFTIGDVVVVDAENRVVTLNGTAIDYTGVFPRVLPGNNTFALTPNGAAFSVGVTETHFARYL